MARKKFQYTISQKKMIDVEFDVRKDSGNEVIIENISLQPNYRSNSPVNPELRICPKSNKYEFYVGYWYTNGDYEQIINRMFKIANED